MEPREDGLQNREKGEDLGKESGSKRVCDPAFLLVLQGRIGFLWHFWLLFSTSVQWLLNTWTRTPHRLRRWTVWSSDSHSWVLLVARLGLLAGGWRGWGGRWEGSEWRARAQYRVGVTKEKRQRSVGDNLTHFTGSCGENPKKNPSHPKRHPSSLLQMKLPFVIPQTQLCLLQTRFSSGLASDSYGSEAWLTPYI